MPDYLGMMYSQGRIIGQWDSGKLDGQDPAYFLGHTMTLDFRGDLRISRMVTFGQHIRTLTASHDFSSGQMGNTVLKKVWVDPGAFIGSYVLLYNCHIKHHAVVACGSVVRNMTVEPYEMVEGNPARVVKRFVDGEWVRVGEEAPEEEEETEEEAERVEDAIGSV